MPDKNKLSSIQVLRAIACLMVICFHYYGNSIAVNYGLLDKNNIINNYMTFGRYGVEIFFLISGFIMYFTAANITPSGYHAIIFFLKRLIRIWPAYIIATFCFSPHFNWHFLSSILFWPFDSMLPANKPTLSLGWTLNYEMYFYLLLFFCLIYTRRLLFYLTIWFSLTTIALPVIYNYYINGTSFNLLDIFFGIRSLNSNYTLLNFIANYINLFFLSGLWLGYSYKKLLNNSFNCFFLDKIVSIVFIISSSCILFFIFNYAHNIWSGNQLQNIDFKYNLAWVLLILSCFVLTFVYGSRKNKFPRSLIFIGNMSYSLYLWQYFTLINFEKLVPHPTLIALFCFILANFVISYISYLLIEIKLHHYLSILLQKIFKKLNVDHIKS